MSTPILSKYEVSVVVNLITYLDSNGCSRLAQRVRRVYDLSRCGLLTRHQFLNGVLVDGVFCAIEIAIKHRDGRSVSDFADLLDFYESDKIDYSKPKCPDRSNCKSWIEGYGCQHCDFRPF